MSPDNANVFGPAPGKVFIDVERYQTQSGQVVEIRRIEMNILENNMLRKERTFEVYPPLADSRIPETVADIRECRVCLSLYHKDNVMMCPVCGGYYCHLCRAETKDPDGQIIALCAICANEVNTGLLKRITRKLWALGT